MTLKEYLKTLNTIVKENPEALGYNMVYAIDDEGNDFLFVNYPPCMGHYNEDDGTFLDHEKNNAICVN